MTEPGERPQDPVPGQQQPYPYAPPPPYGYPQIPGYGPQGYYLPPPPPGMVRPSNYLGWAIATIFLFWPIAIAALIKSSQVDRLWAEAAYGESVEASRTTKTLCIVATCLGGAFFVAGIIVWLVVFSTVMRYAPPLPR
ncbi:CD225/dispanin family protein [Kibdelosporangium lantanae]|uniref:CD225/dispanin family protein n=1 Tax=Kibdelosporangium lantanae TaxID=1497396 RepID=A0ABW3MCX6_9PSEU